MRLFLLAKPGKNQDNQPRRTRTTRYFTYLPQDYVTLLYLTLLYGLTVLTV